MCEEGEPSCLESYARTVVDEMPALNLQDGAEAVVEDGGGGDGEGGAALPGVEQSTSQLVSPLGEARRIVPERPVYLLGGSKVMPLQPGVASTEARAASRVDVVTIGLQ